MFRAPRESLVEFSGLHCNAVICLPQRRRSPARGISPILPPPWGPGVSTGEWRVPRSSAAEQPWDAGELKIFRSGICTSGNSCHVPVGINKARPGRMPWGLGMLCVWKYQIDLFLNLFLLYKLWAVYTFISRHLSNHFNLFCIFLKGKKEKKTHNGTKQQWNKMNAA